jgi:8-oxo-dGTP pyrophosphatase MutT (NUDIX family)
MASLRRLQELGGASGSFSPPPNVKRAAVTLLLFREAGDWRVVLIRRTANPHDVHSGQLSFPGGRIEPTDPGAEVAALREAEEEIGIPTTHMRVLGPLTELYIPVSNFLVHPFVAVYEGDGRPSFQLQPGEVEYVLTPLLSHFGHAETRRVKDLDLGAGFLLPEVPYFDVEGQVLWGATAMILNEFLEII